MLLFSVTYENMTNQQPTMPLKGSLLLASPLLCDGLFDRSVILMTEYGENHGGIGFILNKPTGQVFGELVPEGRSPHELWNVPVYVGGPVDSQNLLFVAFWKRGTKLHYKAPVSMEDAIQFTRKPGAIVQAYAGHSGWTPGKLEDELNHATWIRLPAPPRLLDMEFDEGLWKTILRSLSPYHAVIAEAPKQPFWN